MTDVDVHPATNGAGLVAPIALTSNPTKEPENTEGTTIETTGDIKNPVNVEEAAIVAVENAAEPQITKETTSSTAENSATTINGNHASATDVNQKPLLLLTAPPVMGHTTPLLRLAKQMTGRGFEVIFMSTSEFKKAIEKTGAEFYESKTPFADIAYLKSRHTLPPGLPTLMADMENMFIKQMAPRSLELRSVLELVRERDPSRDVVVITETMSLAPMPFVYGAPLPKGYEKFPKTININTVPIMILSSDTGLTGSGLPPDASESGRARNNFINQMVVRGPFGGTDRVFHQSLKDLGCTSLPKTFFQNAWLDSYDTTFQLCVPSLEYPRADLHLSIRFCGAFPKGELDPNFQYPSWWEEIKSNATLPVADRKKIVAVTQGTVALDYADLIIPTIKGLAKRPDVIVVAILGVKGASLQATDDFEVPSNARTIDFLPYDAILAYADIFLSNGGYGGLAHGVLNGVPMILAGTSEDKAEVCLRGAYAGFAINLNVQRPTGEQIYEASEKIFSDPTYKHRALRLMQENEDLDAISIIERQVLKYGKAV
ncbi:hypothetical protein BJ170DRAFT_625365 [Xylariales sp. AK1849]|nr:hypothetical protein BJ170DRAFT_625365 [Xylariales sp. AK1849]